MTTRLSIAACAMLLAAGIAGAPAASAATTCLPGSIANGATCTLDPGETIILVLKGGNGGAGGSGGAGGAGGAGWSGTASIPGGTGGAGGTGGPGGAGAKWRGAYTNTTGATVTLTFAIGTNGAAGVSRSPAANGVDATRPGPAANGGTGVSGDGGGGGAAGTDSTVSIGGSAIATALGGSGGSGGVGGSGGQGGQVSGSTGNGPAGASGTAGADATGGNLSTSNVEAPFIEIVAPDEPTPAATNPPAPTFTVTWDARGGQCASNSESTPSGTWIPVPSAAQCSKSSAILAGWQTVDGQLTFAPGAMINVTGDATLRALWRETQPEASGSTGADSGQSNSSANASVTIVIWGLNGELRSGNPSDLNGRKPVFTLVTTQPRRVTDAAVAQAQALAARYGGTYAGIVEGRAWVVPRVVAAVSN